MLSEDKRHTVNVIHLESTPEEVWKMISTVAGSNAYLSDFGSTTGDPDWPKAGDKFRFTYGDIENETVCLESQFPHLYKLADSYVSILSNGDTVEYKLQTTFTIEPIGPFVMLTVEVEGYGNQPQDMWLRECMETGWRRSLINLKCVLELGLDLRFNLFGYPRLGVTNTGHSELYAAETGMPAGKGNYIMQAFPQGPAYRAGLRSGDVILSVNGTEVNAYKELVIALSRQYNKRKPIKVVYARDQQVHETEVDLSYDERFTGFVDAQSKEELQRLKRERSQDKEGA
ncbi:PDZ domain-containing protein [Paenibacillus sp. FSL M8-0334]|uniref:PDZ domain-containing protein n=1 Tax=Paenibacillus sp. FSL M8-0334 TaxID=2921623 RepID=UPI0030F9588F